MAGTSPGMMRLLRGNPPFRLLWTARATSYMGDSLGLVALLLSLQRGTGEAFAVAALLLVGDFLPGLLGPVTGTVGDRFDLRRVMVTCEVLQAAATLAIALTLPPPPVLLALVALRGITAQVFQPASRGAVPALVADRDLETANSALGAGTYGLEAVGPLLAAALLPVLDIRGVLLVDVLTFVISAALLLRLPRLPPPKRDTSARLIDDTKAGLHQIWRIPSVRAIALGFFAVAAFNGVDDVAMVFLAKDTLHGGDSSAALLYAGVGLGLAAGYPLLARYGSRMAAPAMLLLGFAISSAGNLLTGLAWAVGAALAMQVVRGAGIAALDVAVNTHLQRVAPASMLARVFGTLYGAVGVAAGLSYVFGGLLLDLTGPRVTFVVAGAGGLAASLATAFPLMAGRWRWPRGRAPGVCEGAGGGGWRRRRPRWRRGR